MGLAKWLHKLLDQILTQLTLANGGLNKIPAKKLQLKIMLIMQVPGVDQETSGPELRLLKIQVLFSSVVEMVRILSDITEVPASVLISCGETSDQRAVSLSACISNQGMG